MRIFSFILVLAALVTIVTGAAFSTDDKCGTGMGCGKPAQLAARDLTNAERLRRGLPLKSPFLRRGTPARRADPSVRPGPNPRPGPPNTISHRGVIQIIDTANGAVLGYVSRNTLNRAQLRHQPGTDSALTVAFKTDQTGSGTNFNIHMKNSDMGFHLLGLVQGLTDTDSVLSSGSSEFAVLAGVATPGTTPGSPPANLANSYNPSRMAESAVWMYDTATGTLSPRWVNPDDSLPTIQSFTQGDDAIYFTGDINAFKAKYPSTTNLKTIAFKFISS